MTAIVVSEALLLCPPELLKDRIWGERSEIRITSLSMQTELW